MLNWETSDYLSLVAIIIAIAIPISQNIYKRLLKKPKINILSFGYICLYFDSYGSTMQSSFTVQCENKDITIEKIEMKAKKRSNNVELNMIWGYMLPIDSKFLNETTIGKRSHPVKIPEDSIEPFTIQFYLADNSGIEFREWVERYRQTPDAISYEFASNVVKKQFFWDADIYDVEGKIFYNKKGIQKFNFTFHLPIDKEHLLFSNVNSILKGLGDYKYVRIQNTN